MIGNRMCGTKTCLVVLILAAMSPPLNAQTWAPQEASSPYSHFSAVSFVNDQIGWVSGAYGVIIKTTNSGATWISQPSGTGLHFSDQYFLNASTGWVVGQDGVIVKTTNGGATWFPLTSGTSAWLNFVQFVDANIGWAAGANGTVIKTKDGGSTWNAQTSGTSATIEGGNFTSALTGFLACRDGAILKTVNAGAAWTVQGTGSSLGLNSIHFANGSTGWICGDGGRILKTSDGGSSWFSQASGSSVNLNGIYFPHADTGWVVGDGGVIRRTTNGGTTWTSQISSTTENLRDADFISPRHGYAVGLNSTVLEYAVVHALPVQIASFTATVLGNSRVRLDWRTVSELNNYGFEVERAVGTPDVFAFLPGGFVQGHGTTNEEHNYSFTDNNAPFGRVYYRLKQVDLDGTINYTEPISVDIVTAVDDGKLPTEFALKQNYPNPFNPSTKIEFSVANPGFVSLRVYDVLGREVATIVNEELNQGSYTKTFSAEGLSSGVYLYKLMVRPEGVAGFSDTKRFVLSK